MLVGPDHGVLAARFPKDDDTGIEFVKPLDMLRGDARETFKLGVRYFEGGAELFVDERSRAVMECPPGEPRGNPTFLIQNARVAFWDVRVLY
jgi:hypothetical protein